jgi:hypothetical protein
MNIKILLKMKEMRNYYNYFSSNNDVSFRDELIKITNYDNIEYSEEELLLMEQYIKSDNPNKIIKELLITEYAKMDPKKIIENIFELAKEDYLDKEILEAIPTNIDILDYVELNNKKINLKIFTSIEPERIIEYINKDKSNKKNILKLLSELGPIDQKQYQSYSIIKAHEILNKLTSDEDRTSMILLMNFNDDLKRELLHTVKNSYYRNLIVKQTSEYNFKITELLDDIDEFKNIKQNFEKIEDEEERSKFICDVENHSIRLELLNSIKLRKNRDIVINGFENEIDPRIKLQVELVQQMIREFFEDELDNGLDDEKKEKMNIIFNKADVSFKKIDGGCNRNCKSCI